MVVTSELSDRFGNILFKIAAGKYAADQIGADWKGLYVTSKHIGYLDSLMPFFGKFKIDVLEPTKEKVWWETEGKKAAGERNPQEYFPINLSNIENKTITGYRQSPYYWNNDKQYVLDLFKTEYDEQIFEYIRNLYSELDFSKLVSINVRRGDYVDWENQYGIGFYGEDYYLACINRFPSDQQFLVVSDDLDWCKTFLKGDRFYFFDKPRENWPFLFPDWLVDFYVQRICKHNIIANSTFSWWAAYLNETPGRKVLCPKSWGRFNKESTNFIPENDNWETVENISFQPIGILPAKPLPKDNKPGLEEALELRYETRDGERVVSFDYSGFRGDAVVVIPTHKGWDALNEYEQESFRNTCKVMKYKPVVLLVPEGLDIEGYKAAVDKQVWTLEAKSDFFKTEAGYFTFMKCPDLYETLMEYFGYMLLVHLDSWVFYDNLFAFEKYGYSYYGAPWYSQVIPNGSVGNGGLCMIRLKDAYRILKADWSDCRKGRTAYDYLADDVYFGLTVHEGFTVAPVHIALEFAWDDQPDYACMQAGNRLPMGCHAFYRFGHEQFWKQAIPILNNIKTSF